MTQTPEPWLRRPGRPVPPGQGRTGWSCAIALPLRPATGRRGVAAVASWFCLPAKAARQTAHFPPPIAQADDASHDARLQGKRDPPLRAPILGDCLVREDVPSRLICMGLSNARVGSALAAQLRRFLLERVQPYPIRLVNWFMSK